MSDDTPSPLNNVITIDDERIKSHLDRVVRGTVTLNALLDAPRRTGWAMSSATSAAGHYERKLRTNTTEAQASIADLRDGDHRALWAAREPVEEALLEMHREGVSCEGDGRYRSLIPNACFPKRPNLPPASSLGQRT